MHWSINYCSFSTSQIKLNRVSTPTKKHWKTAGIQIRKKGRFFLFFFFLLPHDRRLTDGVALDITAVVGIETLTIGSTGVALDITTAERMVDYHLSDRLPN